MSPWRAELHHFVRGFAGAFLVGAPFLYTIEVWWSGETGSAGRLLAALWGTFGAIAVIASTLAPAEEIPAIATGLTPAWPLVLAGASVALTDMIVFTAHFVVEDEESPRSGAEPAVETATAYVISLGVAAIRLWLFQRVTAGDPASLWASHVVVLPASIAGAAGRLAP